MKKKKYISIMINYGKEFKKGVVWPRKLKLIKVILFMFLKLMYYIKFHENQSKTVICLRNQQTNNDFYIHNKLTAKYIYIYV